ncbi:MAG: TerB family tellurite resistance protein [Bacteroidales bacterium]|nr:TerB family tellurite resistance protein [Bacteroidales bacterium]
MSRIFTFILGGLGWAFGGVIGGLIGAAVGTRIDSMQEAEARVNNLASSGGGEGPTRRRRYSNTGSSNDHVAALMVLIAAVMRADGVARQSELDYVKAFLRKNYTDEQGREMLLLLRGLVNQPDDIDAVSVCRQIKVNTDYSTRYHIYDFLFGVACADNDFSMLEHSLLQDIGRELGISHADYVAIRTRRGIGARQRTGSGSSSYSRASAHSRADNYAMLGLQPSATDDEVRRAYRRLAMKYHPDRVESLGEQMRSEAEEQFKKINLAYEAIKKERGLK